MSSSRVGLIGLGTIGLPMARRILDAGFALTVNDVRPERVEQLVALGASAASTAAAVADQSDMVLTSLPTVQAWEDVYFGATGLVSAARDGLTLIETSTLTPSRVRRVADAVAGKGTGVVDAALLVRTSYHPECSVAASAADIVSLGLVTVPVGGTADDVARVWDVLTAFGDPVLHLGPLGSGLMVKVLNNAISHGYFVVALEVLAVAAAAEMDLRELEHIFEHTSAQSAALAILANCMEHGEGGRVMNLASGVKDSESILELAREHGVPSLMQNVNHAYYQMAASTSSAKDVPWDGELVKLFEGFARRPLRFDTRSPSA